MGITIAFISNDPISVRVMPKLLERRGYDVRVCETIDALTPGLVREAHVSLLDNRIPWDEFDQLWAALESSPVILLHHGPATGLSATLRGQRILASVDAQGSTFEAMLASILKWLQASASGDFAQSSVAHSLKRSTAHAEGSSPQSIEAIPGRIAVGRVVQSTGRLKWHELYRDQGQLKRELTTTPLARSQGAAKARPQFERKMPRDEAVARVAEYSQARPLKSTVSLALRIARDSTATVEDMARVVKQDQALAARVLQLANSSLHRRGSAVRTVEQAIVRMGVASLRETISSSNVLDQFEDASGVLNVPLLWEHGYAVGMLAADLARATRVTQPDDAFMIGLLHDMGRAVMATEIGEDYIEALLEARRYDLQPAQVEKQFFEINHADVADTVFANWEFDAAITAPIANHHLSVRNLNHLAPMHVHQTKLLQAADTLAHAALLGDSGSDWIDAGSLDVGGSPLSPGLIRSCLERAHKTLEEIRLMTASASQSPMKSVDEHMREQLPRDASIGWADGSGKVDLMGILAWTLNDHRASEEPADVLMATVRNREEADYLKQATKQHDTGERRVPLMLSVPGEAISKDLEAMFPDRPKHVVPQAFRVSWVMAGLRDLLAAA